MGAVKICVHRTAETPFYVKSMGVRLYSIEELAYFLYENIYLIDEQLVDEKLYLWLETELGLEMLAEKLRNGKTSGNHVYNQVMSILQASEYYSEEELSKLSEKIREISGLQTQERMKAKADVLSGNGNYWSAVLEYEKLLSIRQSSRLSVEFYAKVWNNLAGCYTRLFLFEKAAGCFENAYQFQKLEAYREKAWYARKLAERGKEPEEELLESGIPEQLTIQAKTVFSDMEKQAEELCRNRSMEEFLEAEEKAYSKISCI